MKDRGFVDAGELLIGDSLLDVHGNVLLIEDIQIEYPEAPTTVYNFQVEDFHTYHVGGNCILVHNDCTVSVSKSRYPESAKHIEDAIADGQPKVLTIDRKGASSRRYHALKGKSKVPGCDLDEYPPAMFAEGGKNSDVRAISPSDNRGSGSYIGNFLRGQPDGAKITFEITD